MSPADFKNELISMIEEKHKEFTAVLMPDFFADRLISLDFEPANFPSLIAKVTERKGGSIDGIAQMDIRGGNAVNTASALASLGVKVTPIICTNRQGLQQMKFFLRKHCIDFSHVKVANRASLTTALEFRTEDGKANVMLRDVGSLANFGPLDLTERDYDLIENADYVCLFNWAGTKKFGTALAETIFRRVKTLGKGKTYYDTADPTPNKGKIPELICNVLKTSQIDILSLNENEAIRYASMLTDEMCEYENKKRFDELAIEAARVLANHLPARIDLHTTVFSATFTKQTEIFVPTFKARTVRATGAGDAWNAGNIFGDGNAFSDKGRLALANAVSAYYLSNSYGKHPTLKKLIRFIENSEVNTPVKA